MNFRKREQLNYLGSIIMLVIILVAVVLIVTIFLSGCYANKTFGHIEFPLTLLPAEQKTEDIRATIEADPTTMVTLQFQSSERVIGGATVQDSKKDIQFDLEMPGFLTIKASGSRSVKQVDVNAAPLIEAVGGAVGEAVNRAIGAP